MNLDRILELLAKQMGNAISEAELAELETLLQQHPNHQHLIAILQSIQTKKLKQPAQNEEMIVREGWEKLQQQLRITSDQQPAEPEVPAPVRSLSTRRVVKWAAAFIGAILVAGLIYFQLKPAPSKSLASIQEAVVHGKPEMKTLPDGSTVWINSGTKINYKADGETRDVYLEGEAFFKVKHDSEHPFIVHAGNIEVKALGTTFNVLAYPGEEEVEATLIEGKVQVVMREKPDQKIILTPNEKLTVVNRQIYNKDTSVLKEISFEVKPVEIFPAVKEAGEVAWVQDKLAFRNESFSTLARRMERRYNVHIVFYDESLKKETLTGIFENESIEKALKVLQMTTPFRYRIKADSVFLDNTN